MSQIQALAYKSTRITGLFLIFIKPSGNIWWCDLPANSAALTSQPCRANCQGWPAPVPTVQEGLCDVHLNDGKAGPRPFAQSSPKLHLSPVHSQRIWLLTEHPFLMTVSAWNAPWLDQSPSSTSTARQARPFFLVLVKVHDVPSHLSRLTPGLLLPFLACLPHGPQLSSQSVDSTSGRAGLPSPTPFLQLPTALSKLCSPRQTPAPPGL